MIRRILLRLSVVWIVGAGLLILIAIANGATMERGAAWGVPLTLLGPPAILATLAWIFAPRR